MKHTIHKLFLALSIILECIIISMNFNLFFTYIIPNYEILNIVIVGVIILAAGVAISLMASNLEKYKLSKICLSSIVASVAYFLVVESSSILIFTTDHLGVERGSEIYSERSVPFVLSLVLFISVSIVINQYKKINNETIKKRPCDEE